MRDTTRSDELRAGFRAIGAALAEVYEGAREQSPMWQSDQYRHEVGIAAVEAYSRTFTHVEGRNAFVQGVMELMDADREGAE